MYIVFILIWSGREQDHDDDDDDDDDDDADGSTDNDSNHTHHDHDTYNHHDATQIMTKYGNHGMEPEAYCTHPIAYLDRCRMVVLWRRCRLQKLLAESVVDVVVTSFPGKWTNVTWNETLYLKGNSIFVNMNVQGIF